ncbi:MAG: tRNA uridine-5-carboxymethylaminomethyl(34) synthesis GTPase MnmE [Candidatus Scalindua sp.]
MSFGFSDTILAVSTPSGRSLKVIIRLSGRDVFDCMESIFVPGDGEKITHEKGFSSCHGRMYLESEKIRIPVCIYIMKSPNSYTREDIIEVHTFGSPPLLEMLMEALLSLGSKNVCRESGEKTVKSIRIAEPGEFTKRAFLNGRISLAEAESVLHIIRSRTDSELLMAVSNLKGRLTECMNSIQGELVKLCARIEAAIDFLDQDIELITLDETKKQLEHIKEKLYIVAGSGQKPRISHNGIKTVLVGWPNAGKSSLFNKLLNRSKAIVTRVSGTTRDTLEADVDLEGMNFRIIDTAGIAYGKGELESAIEQRTYSSIDTAQIVLFVIDGCMNLSSEQIKFFDSITTRSKIIVINKNDLQQKMCYEDLPPKMKAFPVVKISVLTDEGLGKLKKAMVSRVFENNIDLSASDVVFTMRQRDVLDRALDILEQTSDSLNEEIGCELVTIDLRKALDTIGEVTGEVLTDDILDRIFSEFCIGK